MPIIKVKSEEVKIKVPVTVLRIEPTTQAKTVEPTIEEQLITPDEGVFALSSVTVNPVTSEIDENIKAENIKEGISILGVEGKLVEASKGSVDIHDYFNETITAGTKNNASDSGWAKLIKRFPNVKVAGNSCKYMFSHFPYDETMLPDIDTSNITTMEYMYGNASALKTIPLLNAQNVTSMLAMLSGCSNLIEIPLLDTKNVTIMQMMFYGCSSLISIPALNTSNLEIASQMLQGCTKLTSIPLLDFGKVVYVNDIVSNSRNIVDLGGFKDLGKAYLPTESANKSAYTLTLSICTKLTEQSLINVLNNLYDIASLGVQPQKCVLGSTNLAKLTSEEGQQALANAQQKGWTVS